MTVPDDVYRAARVRAGQSGTSVSALVAQYLRALAGPPASDFGELEARQRQIASEIDRFRGSDRLSRDQVHARAVR